MALINDPVRFHDELAAGWEQKYQKASFRNRLNTLLSLVPAHNPCRGKWLDAGCGSGTISRILALKGYAVTGIDRSSKMIEVARGLNSKFEEQNKPEFEMVETVEMLGYENSTFDGVICSSVLEYVDNPMKAVEEFRRVLKPDGLLIVSVPNRLSLFRNIQKLLYRICLNCFGIQFPAYLELSKHDFRRSDFRQALLDRGFVPISQVGSGPYLPGFLARTTLGSTMILFAAKRVL